METTYNKGRTILKDDRTEEQMLTHTSLVTATDKFLSGWGGASGGVSKCAWACTPEQFDRVNKWVESRSDMKHINFHTNTWKPANAKHVHIYVVDDSHPALN